MPKLQVLQEKFLNYLRYADTAIEGDIVAGEPGERARRLSIYYNAYRVRLRDSIETDHPVLGVYLGDEGFARMSAAFIDANPSSETSLRHFCDALPAFLRQQPPFSDVAVLAELATFERLLMNVFDAADAIPVNEEFLASLTKEQWPGLTLRLHPSVRTYVTDWNCVEIWRAIRAEQTPPDARRGDMQAWLLWRNHERLTEFRSLPIDEFEMIKSALVGDDFAKICETMLQWHVEDEVAARVLSLLRVWIGDGLAVVNENGDSKRPGPQR